MKCFRTIKEMMEKSAIEHRVRTLKDGVFHIDVRKERVYIKCNEIAIKSMPLSATMNEILSEMNEIKETAINYEN